MTAHWLPDLVLFESCGGNWIRYVELLYSHFKRDFVDSRPTFQGNRLGLKRHPVEQGKEATFWHMISEGTVEAERLPNMRRCERIRWPRPLVEKVPSSDLRVWNQCRNGERRIAIAVDDFSYVFVLAERKDGKGSLFYLPWTTFYVKHEHSRRKYEKEWNSSKICWEQKG